MRCVALGILCLISTRPLFAQTGTDDSTKISARVQMAYIHRITEKSQNVSYQISRKTTEYLNALEAKEVDLQKKLTQIDPAAASRVFSESQEVYTKLQLIITSSSDQIKNAYGKYYPGIDSALTSLKFLQQRVLSNPKLANQGSQITFALSKVQGLQDEFNKANNVKDFIRQREAYLQQQLSTYSKLGSSLSAYKSKAYYYSQTISQLKEDWQEPSRMEARMMTVLNRIPAFKTFMSKNSLIAGLFNLPDDYGTAGTAGLQTRAAVQGQMAQQMQLMGPTGSQTASVNIENTQSSLAALRDRLQKTGSAEPLPDTDPNPQKTKTFLKRLEYGFNMQNNKSSYLLPASSDVALTLGYKINDKSSVGIGASYKVGWGQPIRHISISSEGIGLRSYLDVKIKGSFYASGGYELDYQNALRSISQLNAEKLWQTSGLIGISKIMSLKTQIAKQTKMQLFWDFLSYYQFPRTSAIKFRVGYNF